MKQKLVSKNYGFEAVESYKKYTHNSNRTNEDIDEIVLQHLLNNQEIERPHAYWAWFQFCESLKSPWLEVTSTYDVPTLIRPFVQVAK